MAHGNQNNDNNEDNPFSFKKFITKKNDSLTSNLNQNNSNNNSNNVNSIVINESDDDDLLLNTKSRKHNSTTNPFSFRQFLNETSNRRASNIDTESSIINNDSTNGKGIKVSTIMNDTDSDSNDDIKLPKIKETSTTKPIHIHPIQQPPPPPPPPLSPPLNLNKTSIANPYLPDFINESIYMNNNEISKTTINNIEDPYLVLESIPNISPSSSPPPPPIIPPTVNTSTKNNTNSYFDLESTLPTNKLFATAAANTDLKQTLNEHDTKQLPSYFDLETNLGGNSNVTVSKKSKTTQSNKSELFDLTEDVVDLNLLKPVASVNKSKIINVEYYQKQLNDKQKIIDEQEKKLEQYQKQLNEIKKKEELETKTLENMILSIEKNLEKTTVRAIEAENLVEKLKIENKNLKFQVQNLSNENEVLKLSSNNNGNLKQIITNYSEQLNQAAVSGEQMIKQLLTGVDTLKLLSSSLESIGKIQEVNSETNK